MFGYLVNVSCMLGGLGSNSRLAKSDSGSKCFIGASTPMQVAVLPCCYIT